MLHSLDDRRREPRIRERRCALHAIPRGIPESTIAGDLAVLTQIVVDEASVVELELSRFPQSTEVSRCGPAGDPPRRRPKTTKLEQDPHLCDWMRSDRTSAGVPEGSAAP